jgi:hypothetical protein
MLGGASQTVSKIRVKCNGKRNFSVLTGAEAHVVTTEQARGGIFELASGVRGGGRAGEADGGTARSASAIVERGVRRVVRGQCPQLEADEDETSDDDREADADLRRKEE